MNKPQPVITTLRLRGVARWRAWAMYAAVRVFGDKKETDGVQ